MTLQIVHLILPLTNSWPIHIIDISIIRVRNNSRKEDLLEYIVFLDLVQKYNFLSLIVQSIDPTLLDICLIHKKIYIFSLINFDGKMKSKASQNNKESELCERLKKSMSFAEIEFYIYDKLREIFGNFEFLMQVNC